MPDTAVPTTHSVPHSASEQCTAVDSQVALIGGGHSLGGMHVETSGFQGSWTADPTTMYGTSADVFLWVVAYLRSLHK